MLRAGPFSDERIVKLINRRFIAVAFDLFSGALHDGDEARYLRARIARRRRDWKSAEQLLAKTKRPDLHDDVRMERAYRLWFARDYAALGKHLAGFPATSNRFAEARYYEGLAAYLGGKRNAALAIWKATVSAAKAHGPWVYRADWAYTNILDGRDRRRGFSMRVVTSGGKTSSLLGRLDYMGMSNPELSGPRAR